MRNEEAVLEPFAPQTLATIRSSFRAGWHELMAAGPSSGDPILRNKLAAAIGNLARASIHDADELKRRALRRLEAGKRRRAMRAPAPAAAQAGAAFSGSVAP